MSNMSNLRCTSPSWTRANMTILPEVKYLLSLNVKYVLIKNWMGLII